MHRYEVLVLGAATASYWKFFQQVASMLTCSSKLEICTKKIYFSSTSTILGLSFNPACSPDIRHYWTYSKRSFQQKFSRDEQAVVEGFRHS